MHEEGEFIPGFKGFTILITETVLYSELTEIYWNFNQSLEHLKYIFFLVWQYKHMVELDIPKRIL